MSTQVENTEQAASREAMHRLRWTVEEVKAMRTTERVFIGAEHSVAGAAAEPYDTASITQSMRSLNQAVHNGDPELIGEAQTRLMDDLHSWRIDILKRDEKMMAFNLRRYCEHPDASLDIHVFAALARFYRACRRVGVVQPKYDLAVTRLFTMVDDQSRRIMRTSRKEIAERLSEMYKAWDPGDDPSTDAWTSEEIAGAVQGFNAFIDEVNTVTDVEDLIDRDLFNRIRTFKSSLGELFFCPDVTAAAIEYNTVVKHKLSTIIEAESDHISDEPEALRDLPELLCDASPGAVSQMAQMLDELQAAEHSEDEDTRKRLEGIVRLLNIACDPKESDPAGQQYVGQEDAPESNAAAMVFDRQTTSETLQELGEKPENKDLIALYLKPGRSAEVCALDLKNFLAPFPEADGEKVPAAEANMGRRVLSLILLADEMLRFDLATKNPDAPQLEPRLAKLFSEMQTAEVKLRDMMTAATGYTARSDAFLHISNHLHGARLRLQSAIVRGSAKEIALQEAATRAAARNATAAKAPRVRTAAASPRRMRMLVSVGVVLIVIASVAFVLLRRSNAGLGRDPEVQILNHMDLPGGEMLADARRRRNVLIAIVRPSWKQLPEDVRRQELEALLRYGKENGLTKIILFDDQGLPAGSADKTHVTLEPLPQ